MHAHDARHASKEDRSLDDRSKTPSTRRIYLRSILSSRCPPEVKTSHDDTLTAFQPEVTAGRAEVVSRARVGHFFLTSSVNLHTMCRTVERFNTSLFSLSRSSQTELLQIRRSISYRFLIDSVEFKSFDIRLDYSRRCVLCVCVCVCVCVCECVCVYVCCLCWFWHATRRIKKNSENNQRCINSNIGDRKPRIWCSCSPWRWLLAFQN